jgi:hypothetical protein
MGRVVSWRDLVALIAAASPVAAAGRPPFAHETMLRFHFLRHRIGLSDLTVEEALFENLLYLDFTGLSSAERIPDQVRSGCGVDAESGLVHTVVGTAVYPLYPAPSRQARCHRHRDCSVNSTCEMVHCGRSGLGFWRRVMSPSCPECGDLCLCHRCWP